jgi:predicted dehydrogenase
LQVEPAFDYDGHSRLYLTVNDEMTQEGFGKRDQFAPELVYFSNCVLEDSEPEPSGEEGICDVRVIEALLESAKTRRPVELEPYQRQRRPSPAQEIHKPP